MRAPNLVSSLIHTVAWVNYPLQSSDFNLYLPLWYIPGLADNIEQRCMGIVNSRAQRKTNETRRKERHIERQRQRNYQRLRKTAYPFFKGALSSVPIGEVVKLHQIQVQGCRFKSGVVGFGGILEPAILIWRDLRPKIELWPLYRASPRTLKLYLDNRLREQRVRMAHTMSAGKVAFVGTTHTRQQAPACRTPVVARAQPEPQVTVQPLGLARYGLLWLDMTFSWSPGSDLARFGVYHNEHELGCFFEIWRKSHDPSPCFWSGCVFMQKVPILNLSEVWNLYKDGMPTEQEPLLIWISYVQWFPSSLVNSAL